MRAVFELARRFLPVFAGFRRFSYKIFVARNLLKATRAWLYVVIHLDFSREADRFAAIF
jgi:hypothetical protein